MKLDLLSSASLLALGTALTISLPDGAFAYVNTMNCTSSGDSGSCTETVSGALTKTDFSGLSVAVDQFEATSNETLKSVVITTGETFNEDSVVRNKAASTQSTTFSLGLALFLNGGGAVTAPRILAAPAGFPSLTLQGWLTHSLTLASGATHTFTSSNNTLLPSSSETNNPAATLASGLSGFVGSSAFNVVFSSRATQSFSATGDFTAALSTYATPSVTITYNYTVNTPEPASLAVLGVGLSGLGVIRRRRKR